MFKCQRISKFYSLGLNFWDSRTSLEWLWSIFRRWFHRASLRTNPKNFNVQKIKEEFAQLCPNLLPCLYVGRLEQVREYRSILVSPVAICHHKGFRLRFRNPQRRYRLHKVVPLFHPIELLKFLGWASMFFSNEGQRSCKSNRLDFVPGDKCQKMAQHPNLDKTSRHYLYWARMTYNNREVVFHNIFQKHQLQKYFRGI